MKLEDQVTSLELSKKLKELGVKQDSLFYWCERLSVTNKSYGFDLCVNDEHLRNYETNKISAFTVAELGEILRPYLNKNIWLPEIKGAMDDATYMINEASSRAKMLIYLIENNLLKP